MPPGSAGFKVAIFRLDKCLKAPPNSDFNRSFYQATSVCKSTTIHECSFHCDLLCVGNAILCIKEPQALMGGLDAVNHRLKWCVWECSIDPKKPFKGNLMRGISPCPLPAPLILFNSDGSWLNMRSQWKQDTQVEVNLETWLAHRPFLASQKNPNIRWIRRKSWQLQEDQIAWQC